MKLRRCIPFPDSPTRATILPAGMLKLKSFNTGCLEDQNKSIFCVTEPFWGIYLVRPRGIGETDVLEDNLSSKGLIRDYVASLCRH
jgi:hypothetical protein